MLSKILLAILWRYARPVLRPHSPGEAETSFVALLHAHIVRCNTVVTSLFTRRTTWVVDFIVVTQRFRWKYKNKSHKLVIKIRYFNRNLKIDWRSLINIIISHQKSLNILEFWYMPRVTVRLSTCIDNGFKFPSKTWITLYAIIFVFSFVYFY